MKVDFPQPESAATPMRVTRSPGLRALSEVERGEKEVEPRRAGVDKVQAAVVARRELRRMSFITFCLLCGGESRVRCRKGGLLGMGLRGRRCSAVTRRYKKNITLCVAFQMTQAEYEGITIYILLIQWRWIVFIHDKGQKSSFNPLPGHPTPTPQPAFARIDLSGQNGRILASRQLKRFLIGQETSAGMCYRIPVGNLLGRLDDIESRTIEYIDLRNPPYTDTA